MRMMPDIRSMENSISRCGVNSVKFFEKTLENWETTGGKTTLATLPSSIKQAKKRKFKFPCLRTSVGDGLKLQSRSPTKWKTIALECTKGNPILKIIYHITIAGQPIHTKDHVKTSHI